MTGPKVTVPEWCESVGPQCPVEGTVYGYYPSLGWNAFFAAAFGLAFILQIGLGIRYKTWTYMIGVGLGCLGETIGYVGRIQMHNNPYNNGGFTIQIVLLIFSPAFLAAGIYLTLKHVVINFGESWSRLRPNWYTYIFIACDITSLVLQSAGGALAATADDNDQKTLDAGTDIMIGGIIFQVVGKYPSSSIFPPCTNSISSPRHLRPHRRRILLPHVPPSQPAISRRYIPLDLHQVPPLRRRRHRRIFWYPHPMHLPYPRALGRLGERYHAQRARVHCAGGYYDSCHCCCADGFPPWVVLPGTGRNAVQQEEERLKECERERDGDGGFGLDD
jgi:hypothetical protein